MTDKRLEEMRDRLDIESEPWNPEPGDKIAGVVVDVSTRDGKYGPYRIVEVDTGDKVFAFHAFHSVADREIKNRGVRTGDVIAIKFLGLIDEGTNSYYGYKVILDRDSTPADVETATEEPSDFADNR